MLCRRLQTFVQRVAANTSTKHHLTACKMYSSLREALLVASLTFSLLPPPTVTRTDAKSAVELTSAVPVTCISRSRWAAFALVELSPHISEWCLFSAFGGSTPAKSRPWRSMAANSNSPLLWQLAQCLSGFVGHIKTTSFTTFQS